MKNCSKILICCLFFISACAAEPETRPMIDIKVQLLYQNKPFEGADIELDSYWTYNHSPKHFHYFATTDSNGTVEFGLVLTSNNNFEMSGTVNNQDFSFYESFRTEDDNRLIQYHLEDYL